MITVETTDATVHVTIPKSEVSADRLNWFVNSLRLEAIVRKSHLTEDEASHFVPLTGGWREQAQRNEHTIAKRKEVRPLG